MLIKNGTIITFDEKNTVIENGAVYIEDNIIKEVGKSSDLEKKYNGEETLDANDKIVMPGLICSHYHAYSAFARGMILDGEPASNFIEVLRKVWWRLDKKLTLEDVYYSGLVSAIDAVKSGTTTLIDHHASPYACTGSLEELSKAFSKVGVRGNYCYEVSERDGNDIAKEGLYENYNFIKKCNDDRDDLITGSFGLHAAFTVSDDILKEAAAMRDELHCGFHVHVSEGRMDEELSQYNYGKSVVKRLEDMNILGEKTIAVHGVNIGTDDLDILKKTNTIVVHNPESNMNNAVGIPPVLDMMNKDILVGLGTDGFTGNMFREIENLYVVHKFIKSDPRVMSVPETIKLAFHNNGEVVRRIFGKPAGAIKPGSFADLIVLDYNSPTPLNSLNAGGHVIFGMNSNNVISTIINGKIVMKNRQLVNVDEEAIMKKSREVSKNLWSRLADN
ncbi:putative aminohydrolase SsnA [Clostridium pasteurianum]|uniref:putative aminohydrolase SsnA n=1 Tax=Clostridium pasteurianum TaxID=1501 RepID=UPI002260EED1|nr:putative aminohydrolase SsnA [Clostridium pasteurianum]UZW14608.1 putative aminohydrolase SsnA [Clostridium pasteurianum]